MFVVLSVRTSTASHPVEAPVSTMRLAADRAVVGERMDGRDEDGGGVVETAPVWIAGCQAVGGGRLPAWFRNLSVLGPGRR